MGDDIALWKHRKRSRLTAAVVYICLSENVPCVAVAKMPQKALEEAFRELLLEPPGFELVLNDAWLSITLPSGALGDAVVSRAQEVAAELGLTLYDPQASAPSAEEVALAERLVERSRPAEGGAGPGLDEVRRIAEEGDPAAMNDLGTRYAEGEGVARNLGEAVAWFMKAAEQDYVFALLNLADCFRMGEGVARDVREVVRLLERAVRQDPCVAAFELGLIHERGEGVERSIDEAERYFTLARTNRHPEAYIALKRIGRTPAE